MAKTQRLSRDAESQLGALGIHYASYERFESEAVLIEGTRNDPDYRWKLTFKRSGRSEPCVTLADAVAKVKTAAMGQGVPAHGVR